MEVAKIDGVKRRGKLLQFGVCPPGEKAAYDSYTSYNEEITIMGSMVILNSDSPAIEVLAAAAVNTDVVVAHTFTLDQFPTALAVVRKGAGLKVQVAGQGGQAVLKDEPGAGFPWSIQAG